MGRAGQSRAPSPRGTHGCVGTSGAAGMCDPRPKPRSPAGNQRSLRHSYGFSSSKNFLAEARACLPYGFHVQSRRRTVAMQQRRKANSGARLLTSKCGQAPRAAVGVRVPRARPPALVLRGAHSGPLAKGVIRSPGLRRGGRSAPDMLSLEWSTPAIPAPPVPPSRLASVAHLVPESSPSDSSIARSMK